MAVSVVVARSFEQVWISQVLGISVLTNNLPITQKIDQAHSACLNNV